jgi:ABC-type antimicrobial peptide transport system permease subunit
MMVTTLRRAAESARWALQAHASSSFLIVAAGLAGMAAALPLMSLAGPGRLRLPLLPTADLGVPLSGLAAGPAALQQRGLTTLGGILLGLAIAASTVALITVLGLAAARASARQSEVVVRRAVGASRRHLLIAGVVEGAVMAAAAAALGAGVGIVAVRWAVAHWPGTIGVAEIAAPLGAVAALGVLIVLGTLAPVLAIRNARRVAAPSALPPGLVVATLQLGISFVALLAAAQLARHAGRLLGEARAPARVGGHVVQIGVHGRPAERAARYASLLAQLGTGGAFELSSLSSPGGLVGLGTVDLVITDCGRCSQGGIATPLRPVAATLSVVSPDTFRAMGLPVMRGRTFAASDGWNARRVAVVSRALATRHFEGGVAVGRKIRVGQGPGDWFTVIGVVEDRAPQGFGGAFQPPYTVYMNALQAPPSAVELLVRARGGTGGARATAVLDDVLRAVLGTSGTVMRRLPESGLLAAEAAPIAWFGRVVSLGGWAVLVIAVLGTFAVMHLWVTALMPELAVRRAVGARRRDVLQHVLARAAAVGLAGAASGLWLGELMSEPLASLLVGLPGIDLELAPRLALGLVAAALAGALVPAWRATRADLAVLTARLEG